MPTLLFVQAGKAAMEVVIMRVSSTLAHDTNISVAINTWKLNVALVRDFRLGQFNVSASVRVVDNSGILATPPLDDCALSFTEASLEWTIDMRIRLNGISLLKAPMGIFCHARNSCTTNIAK